MNKLPFRSVEEAKENAKRLSRTLAFYLIHMPGSTDPIGLRQTQEIIAKLFGCLGWSALTTRLELRGRAAYLDDGGEDPGPMHLLLSSRLHEIIGGSDVPTTRIRAALSAAALGCSPLARREADNLFPRTPCKNIDQWQSLMQVHTGNRYVSRYNNHRTTFELEMIEYWRIKAEAEILGLPMPSKPRQKGGRNTHI